MQMIFTILICALCFLLFCALLHSLLLLREKKHLVPNGTLHHVNGHALHVYSAGANHGKPTLVFLSGSATVAPVYDFKPLYERLSGQYPIAVVERAGYGYSDIAPCARNLASTLMETRQALLLAGHRGPYVLLPHSMSGLEALLWAQTYPKEVKAIIGLDMATPLSYRHLKIPMASVWLLYALGHLGIQRLSFLNLVSKDGLSAAEYRQARYLAARNFCNIDCALEGKVLYDNAALVEQQPLPDTSYLLFSSNGKEIGSFWLDCQAQFAAQTKAELVRLACGHYLYHFEADAIADKISCFLAVL